MITHFLKKYHILANKICSIEPLLMKRYKLGANFCTATSLTVQKSVMPEALSLKIYKSESPSVLVRKPDEVLINQWWSQSPFDSKKPIIVPIYSLHTGEYIGENVELDQSIFNLPLRRDIIHNVFHWRRHLNKITTHISRTVGTVSGSGKKPHPQKKTGRARQGNLRAPGRKKGGKAHGAKPRDFTYDMPKKIRLLALKTMLSARLAEGKIRIVDNEKIETAKTKIVAQILKQFDEKTKVLLVTSYKPDPNFERSQKNIPLIELAQPHNLTVNKILAADKLLITKEGLEHLIQELKDRTYLRFRMRANARERSVSEIRRARIFNKEKKVEELPKYDPTKPLTFRFKILEEYLKQYEATQKAENKGQEQQQQTK